MRLLKSTLSHDWVRSFACWLVSLYIRFVFATVRWQVFGDEIPKACWQSGKPLIVCFWHGRLLMLPKAWRPDQPFHMLISHHRDGQLISKTVGHFGIKTIAGSSSKGGTAALRSMIATLKNNETIGITPDGPRGPRMRVSDGIIAVAKLSGVPITPLTFSTARGKVLSSWDRFLIPFPFSKGVMMWGDPISVPRDADEQAMQHARHILEGRLNAITEQADGIVGREPVLPAPKAAQDSVP